MDKDFWRDKKVFVTGHTGFKGSWLCLWLASMGARVTGYALAPPTNPSMFVLCGVDEKIERSVVADLRDRESLAEALGASGADIVFHLAAQPLVRESYKDPVGTYDVNVMGTVNLLEAVRLSRGVRAVVLITTDKCYENHEWVWGYRENEPLGGYDPYSNSKACCELVASSYRDSFFNAKEYARHRVALATVRAGNVIGGGDWADDRLVPDCVRSFLRGETVVLRYPRAIRPWQHVIEPLAGYLEIAQRLHHDGSLFAEAWNFGPNDDDAKPVEWIVKRMCASWGDGATYAIDTGAHPHEASYLKLDCSKAKTRLGWRPRWSIGRAIDAVIEWTREYQRGGDLSRFTISQIEEYSLAAKEEW
ncbi:MAG TPA: CDP-glucose 4,6-dehydratase [Spirochaetota bacterium]|nr:CDP-glucose 4,6-dehydratase [Spirochaetota bacterium]